MHLLFCRVVSSHGKIVTVMVAELGASKLRLPSACLSWFFNVLVPWGITVPSRCSIYPDAAATAAAAASYRKWHKSYKVHRIEFRRRKDQFDPWLHFTTIHCPVLWRVALSSILSLSTTTSLASSHRLYGLHLAQCFIFMPSSFNPRFLPDFSSPSTREESPT